MRRTKIVATLGPSSWEEETMGELLAAGVNVFRINTAHGTSDLHRELISRVRRVAGKQPVAVLPDTRGPKVRVGELPKSGEVSSGKEGSLSFLPTLLRLYPLGH